MGNNYFGMILRNKSIVYKNKLQNNVEVLDENVLKNENLLNLLHD